MWQKIIQMTIVALIDVLYEKAIRPLIDQAKKAIEVAKRKRSTKKKVEAHTNAQSKDTHKDTFDNMP